MSKQKIFFKCSHCTYTSIKWIGCCPQCKQWDSFIETTKTVQYTNSSSMHPAQLIPLSAIDNKSVTRILSGIHEWDRVVGGGLVTGSLIIVTGDPGIGKSTLLLQIADKISHTKKVFYISTEESLLQIKQRSERLAISDKTLLFCDTAELVRIITTAREERPDVIIIDSIQNCYINDTQSAPGSINQLREATFQLMRLSKEYAITTILTGHITKEGIIAGPKTLEHMVDAVFYLQGEDRWQTRILRAVKNRFGAVNEIGFFVMESDGMREVPNINAHLINDISHAPGSALVSVMEGSKPLLLELQALTNQSKLTMPQRIISGLDHKQVVLVAAILEKYIKIKLSLHDIFFKVSGGFSIKGSDTDLGIACALLSSYFQEPLPEKSMALGEISLTGHIKPINHSNMLIKEAEKFGINTFLVAKNQNIEKTSCSIKRISSIYELVHFFGK